MLILLNYLYSVFYNDIKILNLIKLNSLGRYLIRSVANIILPIYLKYNTTSRSLNCKDNSIIVTLTSFPKRINNLWLTIETLLSQTVKPDRIILYLSKDQFPNLDCDLPIRLINQKERGLEIVWVDGDIRSHKKYYYTMSQYPQSIIITTDDDMFYPSDMIEDLLSKYYKYNCVVCRYARKIEWYDDEVLSSNNWKHIKTNMQGCKIFFGTGGGVLFPPINNSLYEDTLNLKLALKLCPLEDDLWLNTMVRLQGTNIVASIKYRGLLPVINKDNETLFSVNGGEQNLTDRQMNNVIRYYKEMRLYPYKNI